MKAKLKLSPVLSDTIQRRGIDGYGKGVSVDVSTGFSTADGAGTVRLYFKPAGVVDASGDSFLVLSKKQAEQLALALVRA